MKQKIVWFLAFACCLALAGCGKEPEPTEPIETNVTEMETKETTLEETETAVSETQPAETAAPEETTAATAPEAPEPKDGDFVMVKDYIPDVVEELKYATSDNFTGQVIYEFQDIYLRYGTVKKLVQVQEELETMELGLKIWDGFRPVAAQFKLWEVCPDPTYVANPEKGYSNHSRGFAVDLTIVDGEGREIAMPTGFDDFSTMADRDYSDCTAETAANAQMLQDIMEKHGFSGYFGEWWHFNDTTRYEVEENFQPVHRAWYYADCNEFISLRLEPDTGAEVITRILVGEEFQVLGWHGDFAYAEYEGCKGYVLRNYIQPVP